MLILVTGLMTVIIIIIVTICTGSNSLLTLAFSLRSHSFAGHCCSDTVTDRDSVWFHCVNFTKAQNVKAIFQLYSHKSHRPPLLFLLVFFYFLSGVWCIDTAGYDSTRFNVSPLGFPLQTVSPQFRRDSQLIVIVIPLHFSSSWETTQGSFTLFLRRWRRFIYNIQS